MPPHHHATTRDVVAQKVVARLPTTSHSLRRLLHRLCLDPEVPIASVRALERAVPHNARDLHAWHAAINTTGHGAVLRTLLALANHAETGPHTAEFIRTAHEQSLHRRARRAVAEAEAAQRGRREAETRQEWLANVFNDDTEHANDAIPASTSPERFLRLP